MNLATTDPLSRKSWLSNPYLLYRFYQQRASFVEFPRLELWDGLRTDGTFWFADCR
jgi:hypothetical protein